MGRVWVAFSLHPGGITPPARLYAGLFAPRSGPMLIDRGISSICLTKQDPPGSVRRVLSHHALSAAGLVIAERMTILSLVGAVAGAAHDGLLVGVLVVVLNGLDEGFHLRFPFLLVPLGGLVLEHGLVTVEELLLLFLARRSAGELLVQLVLVQLHDFLGRHLRLFVSRPSAGQQHSGKDVANRTCDNAPHRNRLPHIMGNRGRHACARFTPCHGISSSARS